MQGSGMADAAVDFFSEFGERVRGIRHILAMMAPWKSPVYLTRIWCIFEMYTAFAIGCDIEIVMPPRERVALMEDLFGSSLEGVSAMGTLYSVLRKTRIQDAQASEPKDKDAILKKVEASPGYDLVNKRMNDLLREWIRNVVVALIDSQEDHNTPPYAALCTKAGDLFMQSGALDASLQMFETAHAIYRSNDGVVHLDTAAACHNVGHVLLKKMNLISLWWSTGKHLMSASACWDRITWKQHFHTIVLAVFCRRKVAWMVP
jgi:hypothetical protein